ncbi:MAG: hypothetical protein N2111_04340 [Candidatus Sumerlaeaceae bacterium]|nr:hypothetical protein [Candidatus Sumerlaeaceae bacterium]
MTIACLSPLRRAVRVLSLVLCAFAFAACEKDMFSFDPDFSVNLFRPGKKWPDEKKFTPAEREVYARYGRPDHFRAWWDPSGTVKQRIEILPRLKEVQKGKNLPPYSWIYLRQGVEVLFAGHSYEEQPLTDQIRILTRYGDPEDSKTLEGGVTQWMYFGAGKLFKFARGRVIEEREFPAMGNYIKP